MHKQSRKKHGLSGDLGDRLSASMYHITTAFTGPRRTLVPCVVRHHTVIVCHLRRLRENILKSLPGRYERVGKKPKIQYQICLSSP